MQRVSTEHCLEACPTAQEKNDYNNLAFFSTKWHASLGFRSCQGWKQNPYSGVAKYLGTLAK